MVLSEKSNKQALTVSFDSDKKQTYHFPQQHTSMCHNVYCLPKRGFNSTVCMQTKPAHVLHNISDGQGTTSKVDAEEHPCSAHNHVRRPEFREGESRLISCKIVVAILRVQVSIVPPQCKESTWSLCAHLHVPSQAPRARYVHASAPAQRWLHCCTWPHSPYP